MTRVLLGGAAAALVAVVVMARAAIPVEPWVWITAGGAAAAGGLVAATAHRAWALPTTPRIRLAVLLVALLARGALLGDTRWLSDDAARYHWDGKLVAHGENPYRRAPSDPALAGYRGDGPEAAFFARINHPDVRTVYPPLAQLLFALAWWLTPGSLLGFRVLVLLAEAFAWALLARRLSPDDGSGDDDRPGDGSRARAGGAPLLLALWSPLLIIEGYLPGHSDLLGLPFLVVFLLAVRDRRPLVAGVGLALACLVKPLPLLFAPAAARELGVRGSLVAAAAFVAVMAAGYLPFAGPDADLFGSMGLMAREWTFNGTLYHVIEAALPADAARIGAGLLLAVLVLASTLRRTSFEARALLAFAAFVALTPVVFPWYLVWVVPLLVLHRAPALTALVALAPLTEIVMGRWLGERFWDPPLWPTAVAFGAFYALAAFYELRRGAGMLARDAASAGQTPSDSRSSAIRASIT